MARYDGTTDGKSVSSGFYSNGKRYIVTVCSTCLTWSSNENSMSTFNIPLREILCFKHSEKDAASCFGKSPKNSSQASFSSLDNLISKSIKSKILIYYGHRQGKHKWRVKTLKLKPTESGNIQAWLNCLEKSLNRLECRPRKLLVFINPFGGQGYGESIYHKKVKPLFKMAGIETEDIVTVRAMHAKDYLLTSSLYGIDGVISVGGDGMFSEILNGFLMRGNDKVVNDVTYEELKEIRLGYIPAGSTDAIANGTHGTVDVVTAALHIVFGNIMLHRDMNYSIFLGDTLAIDICSIFHKDKFLKYSSMFHGYGYFGETLKRSERYRWLGPHRYDLAGVVQFISNTNFEGKVSMLSALNNMTNPLQYGDRCTSGCDICAKSAIKVEMVEPVQEEVNGKFLAINGLNAPCKCRHAKQGLSPSAHLGDGNLDLVLVHKTSRFNNLRYLFRSAVYPGSQFKLPFVEVHRVKEFTFTPGGQRNQSAWNCDGELILEPSLTIRNNHQLVKVFARGIEDHKTSASDCDTHQLC